MTPPPRPPIPPPQQSLIQQQRLILTQELQLFLKLIQMTTLELKEYLEEQLIENPILEEEVEEKGAENTDSKDGEDFNFKSFEDSFFGGRDQSFSSSKEFFEEGEEEIPWESRVSETLFLLDHLKWQLSLSDFSTEDKQIASLIIGNTNEDGYLETDLEEIALLFIKRKCEIDPNSAT